MSEEERKKKERKKKRKRKERKDESGGRWKSGVHGKRKKKFFFGVTYNYILKTQLWVNYSLILKNIARKCVENTRAVWTPKLKLRLD